MQWHNLSVRETLRSLSVREKSGLSQAEVLNRQKQYGKNKLIEKKKSGIFRKFLEQFSDFMVILLLIAAIISFLMALLEENGDFIDPIIILFIVVLNAIIGVIQENKAEHAIEELQKLSVPESQILRDGKLQKIAAEEIVPGDILFLKSGDLVPADARLLSCIGLKTEESALTGESFPVEKNADFICVKETEISEQKNMVFSSTAIVSGSATAVVVETGMNTQMGKIATLLINEKTPDTPLQLRLEKTGKILGITAIFICILIFGMGLLQKIPALDMLMISVSLAVAAIPEGLPAVVTIVLAFGVRKMAQRRAIIRKLPAVETLGSATVICTDKTGTLTQNRMTVQKAISVNGPIVEKTNLEKKLVEASILCNNTVLKQEKGGWNTEGEPTETALARYAVEHGAIPEEIRTHYPRILEFPFSSERKRMSTVHRLPSGGYRIIVKGAPELILEKCTEYESETQIKRLDAQKKEDIISMINALSGEALRVLGVAYRDVSAPPGSPSQAENSFTLIGFLGLIDPPRPEAKKAVETCKKAGIRPIMITGDHAATASAIAAMVGIHKEGAPIIVGSQLDAMTQEELEKSVVRCCVFARVSPEHKVRIVRALQKKGNIVAMTGDGVNDAPALKCADIGCAMGKSGTAVAKSAADMILTDDNFATIVSAVSEGRGIYANIKKAVHFLLSCNIGEIFTVFLAFLMKLPTPLLAIQLLWVNLVTDSLPALALGCENKDRNVMTQKPIPPGESIFAGGLWKRILSEGSLIGCLSLLAFVIGRCFFDLNAEIPTIGRTMTFAVLSLSQLVHAFSVRSEQSIFHIGFFSNRKMVVAFLIGVLMQSAVIMVPALAGIFKTVPLTLIQWVIVWGLSFVPLFAVELEKALSRRQKQRRS